MPVVTVFWLTAFLDTEASDAPAVEAYWSAVTGWPASEHRGESDEFATLEPPDGDGPLKLQVVGSAPPNGMHLDVHTDDLALRASRLRLMRSLSETCSSLARLELLGESTK